MIANLLSGRHGRAWVWSTLVAGCAFLLYSFFSRPTTAVPTEPPANEVKAPTNLLAPWIERYLATRKPNIIFVLADDLGYGDLGCYGQTKIKTPHLDRLAAEGMRFTQFYAGSTVCAPSRATLMTGLHTGHVSIRGNAADPLATHELTVAQLLQQTHYQTACVGKWGLGLEGSVGMPTRKGFQDFVGYLSQTHAHDYYPTQLYRNDLPFQLDRNLYGNQGTYSHDFFTFVASNYVRVAKYQPFFLYLAYTIPHAQNELKKQGMVVPSAEPYTTNDWPAMEKNKAAMITRLDRDVGALMEWLHRLKIETNTVLFFSSDNGPHQEGGVDPQFFASSGPLRGIKRDLYEGGIRVPLIVRWPGTIRSNSVSDAVFAFWDFLPTAAEIAGVKAPAGLDGLSFLPTLLGQPQTNRHEFLYWEFHEGGSKQAVRLGDWKAIRLAIGAPLQLYNLKSDLGETQDVAAQHPEVVEKIEQSLRRARTESKVWPMRTKEQLAAERKKKAAEPPPPEPARLSNP